MLLVCPKCSTSYRLNITTFGPAGREVRCARCRHVWVAHDQAPEPAAAAISTPLAQVAEAHAGSQSPPPDEVASSARDGGAKAGEGLSARTGPEAPTVDDAPPLAPDSEDVMGREAVKASSGKLRRQIPSGGMPKLPLPNFSIPRIPLPGPLRSIIDRYRGLGGRVKSVYIVAVLVIILAVLLYERTTVVRVMPQMASLYDKLGAETNLRGLAFDEIKAMIETEDGKNVLLIEGALRNITGTTLDVPRLRFAVRDASGADIYAWIASPERSQLKAGEHLRFHTRLASPPLQTRDAYVRFLTREDAMGASN
jgi:predicted Zn finger-like uncharacterized protein